MCKLLVAVVAILAVNVQGKSHSSSKLKGIASLLPNAKDSIQSHESVLQAQDKMFGKKELKAETRVSGSKRHKNNQIVNHSKTQLSDDTMAPGFQAPFYNTSNAAYAQQNFAYVSFLACGGDTLYISGCDAPSTGNQYLTLYAEDYDSGQYYNDFIADSNNVCNSSDPNDYYYSTIWITLGFDSSICANYTVREGCWDANECSGTITVSGSTGNVMLDSGFFSTTPTPTNQPTYSSAPTLTGFQAPSYNTTDTNDAQQNFAYVSFEACGGDHLVISGCDDCSGNQYLELYLQYSGGYSTPYAWSNTECANNCTAGMSSIIDFRPYGESSECYNYTLHEGCYNQESCSGTITITGSTGNVALSSGFSEATSSPTYAPYGYSYNGSYNGSYYYDDDDANDTNVQGFFQYEYWDGTKCNGTKTYITGFASNTCTQHASGNGSYKVQFDDANCTNVCTEQYTDLNCQDYFDTFAFGYSSDCFPALPNTFLASGRMMCAVGDAQIDSDATVMSYYSLSDTTCDFADTFTAFTNNYCFNVGELNAAQNDTNDDYYYYTYDDQQSNGTRYDDYYYGYDDDGDQQFNNVYITCDVAQGESIEYTFSNPTTCEQTLAYPYTHTQAEPLTCASTEYYADDDLFAPESNTRVSEESKRVPAAKVATVVTKTSHLRHALDGGLPTPSPSPYPSHVSYDNAYMKVACSNPNSTAPFVPSQQPTPLPTAPAPSQASSSAPSVPPVQTPVAASTTIPTQLPTTTPTTCVPSKIPTAVPSYSAIPTQRPTLFPTFGTPTVVPSAAGVTFAPSASNLVVFNGVQAINGFSYTSYLTDSAGYDATFIATIAASMDGVLPADIQDFVASPLYGRRRLNEGRGLAAIANSNISIAYTVNAHVSGQTYTTLTSQLNTAITSGAFNEYMGGYAQQYQVTGLTCATSTLATTSEGADTSSSGSSSSSLSGGAIGGIVVGVLGGLAIFAFLAFYFVNNKESINNTRRPEKKAPNDVEPAEAVSIENPLSAKGSARVDMEMSATSYKQSENQQAARKPDVGVTVGDDNM